jgi:hypothetical protein
VLGLTFGVTASSFLACSSDAEPGESGTSSGGPVADAGADRRLAQPFRPDAACAVTIESPPLLDAPHVTEGTPITYNSNPPSSGPHFPLWADFIEYDKPLEDGYLVHSLEHGAVALLYKCEGAACAPILEGLRKVRDALPSDPLCETARVRVIIAPYPKLDVPVAAAAWGWTYKAGCVDLPTLTQFAKDNYAIGPENICAPGRTF